MIKISLCSGWGISPCHQVGDTVKPTQLDPVSKAILKLQIMNFGTAL